ncbi:hypothetical protein HanIR_Chr03g0144071 [Helianthus annuus]|nr:hypothetical protein HanIR_Chr03g0144071 [Helianthus annuus]
MSLAIFLTSSLARGFRIPIFPSSAYGHRGRLGFVHHGCCCGIFDQVFGPSLPWPVAEEVVVVEEEEVVVWDNMMS